MQRFLISLIALVAFSSSAFAEGGFKEFWKSIDWEFNVNAGTNIGGASPLPIPAEIRKINSFNPKLQLQLGAGVIAWMGEKKRWGVGVGVRVETKGMETNATVKNYGMSILQDGRELSGRWTGRVVTTYHSQQLVIPIVGVYKFNRRWKMNFGPFLSYAFSNDFYGHVYDGYLREGDPTGQKVVFEDGAKASYDFGENLRDFQWGMQVGASWRAYRNFEINANLTWGCNSVFKSDFHTITFNMYPIYVNLGFGYIF